MSDDVMVPGKASVVQPSGWVQPRGYSNGMTASGRVLAVAGQIAWDAKARLVEGGFAVQFQQALENVADVVRAAEGTPEDIISLTIYVTDKAEYVAELPGVGEAYRRVLGKHFPAMALVEVKGLLEVGAKVEIQALAVLP